MLLDYALISKTIQLLKYDGIDACRQTIGEFFQSLRNVCLIALDKKNLKLGGDCKVVEIDESLFENKA